jgi:hypothetical protein
MIALQLTGYADRGTWIKMTVSTGFIMSAFLAGGHTTRYGNAILMALFFSWWGDLFLDLKNTFEFGLVAFLLGHVFFSVAFLVHGVNWKWVLRVPLAACQPVSWREGPGGLLVARGRCGDVLCVRYMQRFVVQDALNPMIGLPLYFGAQYVFAYTKSVLRTLADKQPVAPGRHF